MPEPANTRRRATRTVVALWVAATSSLLATACATTVEDDDDTAVTVAADDPDADGDRDPDTGSVAEPLDDAAPSRDAAELLPAIADDARRLSSLIGGEGDPDAALERIEAAWDAVRDEIETTRPELFSGLDAVVEMLRTAVVSNRPADADKAYALLIDLIVAFDDGA